MSTLIRGASIVAIACYLAVAAPALADEGKRVPPDYDGVGNTDAEAGSWALWIPRVVLSPLYLLNEFVIARPLGALVRHAESHRWAQSVSELFTFGPSNENLIVPTALIDFGLLPSIGVYIALDDTLAPHNDIRIHAATGGKQWLSATLEDRYSFTNARRTTLSARGEYTQRPDFLFLGVGPDVTYATHTRYGLAKTEGSLSFAQSMFRASNIKVTAGIRHKQLKEGDCCGDPSLTMALANGSVPTPPGYDMPFTVLFQSAAITLDSRDPNVFSATGAHLVAQTELQRDVTNDRTWIDYGATVGGALDLSGHHRILQLQTGVEMVDPIRGGVVPFTELAQLGSDTMEGFVRGWMNGRSTFSAELAYRWPIWILFDGQARFSVGNAFDEHLSGLGVDKLRLSADIGLRSVGSRDHGFEILFGAGTQKIEDGAHITSVRFSIGSRRGF